MTPREHALRVAALEALSNAVATEYKKSRGDAEIVFRDIRRDGVRQQEILLPGGTPVGLLSIKAGGDLVDVDEAELLAYVDEHNPDGCEEYVDPDALSRPDVTALIREHFPELVRQRVRPATRDAYVTEAAENGGIVGAKTGKPVKVATVTPFKPTGDFAFAGAGSTARRKALMAELGTNPDLRELTVGGLLAIGPAGGGGDE